MLTSVLAKDKESYLCNDSILHAGHRAGLEMLLGLLAQQGAED